MRSPRRHSPLVEFHKRSANANLSDISGSKKPFNLKTDYRVELKKNQEIFIKTSLVEYFSNDGKISTSSITESKAITKDFYLEQIGQEEVGLDGIEYDLNSAKLRSSSGKVLDELYGFLKFNSGLIVQINSHTGYRESDSYNLDLSKRRAQSCVDYLIKKEFPKDQMVAKGYGETTPNYLKDKDKKEVLDANGKRVYLTQKIIATEKFSKLKNVPSEKQTSRL